MLCQMHDINSMGNALAQNGRNSLPCSVSTCRQRSCNERVGCLLVVTLLKILGNWSRYTEIHTQSICWRWCGQHPKRYWALRVRHCERRKSLKKKFWRHKNQGWGEEEWERKPPIKEMDNHHFYDVTCWFFEWPSPFTLSCSNLVLRRLKAMMMVWWMKILTIQAMEMNIPMKAIVTITGTSLLFVLAASRASFFKDLFRLLLNNVLLLGCVNFGWFSMTH